MLQRFRRELYDCFGAWRDTLFELVDALLVSPQRPSSVPWLTLETPLRRGHGSVYKALKHGRVDTQGLARTLTRLVIGSADVADPLVFALDCSQWPRPGAVTSPGRTLNYDAAKDRRDRRAPVTEGWWFQWLAATNSEHSSWAPPVDLARIGPDDNHHAVAVTQIRSLLDRLPADRPHVPVVCLDGDYSASWIGRQLAGLPVQMLIRVRSDSVMRTDPPPRRAGARGRPPVHGPAMKLPEVASWPEPDEIRIVPPRPDRGRRHELSVLAWHGLHPRHSKKLDEPGRTPHPGKAREIVRGSVIRIHSAAPDEKPIWLFWTGPGGSFDLDRLWRAYLRRFHIEHLFRFIKQHLGWTAPRLRTPEQAERWSWLIAASYTHLHAARDLVADHRLPWERAGLMSPLRVKRGFRILQPELDTPAKSRKPSQPGPGRPPGRTSTPAPRHPVTRKHPSSPKPKTHNKKRAAADATAR
ncbi:transposase [Lentzea sp. E54]|uniref:transposase n=1 Tax=Lentzea xerophila TaxID=3435883 RepID=UPI003DA68811